jgi:hypothetical protein
VGVRIRVAILVLNVLWLEGHLEPNCHFAFQMFPDLGNILKSSGSSLYECSISYSTSKRSFAPRILISTSVSGKTKKKPFPHIGAHKISNILCIHKYHYHR